MRVRKWLSGVAALGAVVLVGAVTRGHTPIASRYNYNEHLFPIFRDRCGSCHVEGGIAPMSLLTYREAYPWAQSIREEVLASRMPIWRAEDGFGNFSNGHALPAAEMDKILEWSSGGYPQGPLDKTPALVDLAPRWELGEPALTLQLAPPFQINEDVNEIVRFFALPTQGDADRWIKAVEFQPGARPLVRDAAVYIDATREARQLDEGDPDLGFAPPVDGSFPTSHPIAIWVPGQAPVTLPDSVAYRLPAGADVVLRVHYKKTWLTEGTAFGDGSTLGLYFTDASPTAVETMIIASADSLGERQAKFTHTIDRDVSVLALLPEVGMEMGDIQVEAVRPDGSREPMLLLRQVDGVWPMRYWFEAPLLLPKGTQIQVRASLARGAERPVATSLLAGTPQVPVRLLLDFVAAVPRGREVVAR